MKAMGYVWVLVWFGYTIPYWIDPTTPLGYAQRFNPVLHLLISSIQF